MWTSEEGGKYYLGARRIVARLETAVYRLSHHSDHGLFLTHVQDTFPLPKKLYGLDSHLIEHVTVAVERTRKNIGILLSGLKGAGKTITAKQLCNILKLPIILIASAYPGVNSFINDIKEDVTIFVDEYEKVFKHDGDALLTVMDGALDNGYRRIFLLTTNSLNVNQNLLERTGRIRYLRNYTDLSLETINEIVDDTLVRTNYRVDIIAFISTLETITIDIVLAIVEEVNIMGKPPNDFKDIFNVKVSSGYCDIYEVIDGKHCRQLKLVLEGMKSVSYNVKHYTGSNFHKFGYIERVIDADTVILDSGRTFVQRHTVKVHSSFKGGVGKEEEEEMRFQYQAGEEYSEQDEASYYEQE